MDEEYMPELIFLPLGRQIQVEGHWVTVEIYCTDQDPGWFLEVENTNNRLRRYLPRSTDPTALTDRNLKSICQRLNATPRKCLNWRTPSEVFQQYLAEIERRIH